MMRRTTGMTLGALTLFVVACSSDAPTAVRRDISAHAGLNPQGASKPRYAEGEYLEVCKDYVLQPGSTAPTSTDFSLVGPNVNTTFSLASGECREIFSIGGFNTTYTVTETVPAGYTAEVQKDTVTAGVYAVGTKTAASSVTFQLGGVGGNGGTGALIVFTNTETPPPPPPPSGCTLTQGYWKTHSAKGPAPYDDAWLNIGPLGQDTPFYTSGKTWYEIFHTPPAGGNVYLQLAHQYMAAKLNTLNGAATTPAVASAISDAEAFFGAVAGPSSTLTKQQKADAKAWASTLAGYNEGAIGPGHCD